MPSYSFQIQCPIRQTLILSHLVCENRLCLVSQPHICPIYTKFLPLHSIIQRHRSDQCVYFLNYFSWISFQNCDQKKKNTTLSCQLGILEYDCSHSEFGHLDKLRIPAISSCFAFPGELLIQLLRAESVKLATSTPITL